MKIQVEKYNPGWKLQFMSIKKDLQRLLLNFKPAIEHIGSTSVEGLYAKPVIDIAVGLHTLDDLDNIIPLMLQKQYIYYEVFNAQMPERRLFVGLKDTADLTKFKSVYTADDDIPHEEINNNRHCHIHCWVYDSDEWIRHIAFREYLKNFKEARESYSNLKLMLSKKNWRDGMHYNDNKNSFIKREELKAIKWFKNNF